MTTIPIIGSLIGATPRVRHSLQRLDYDYRTGTDRAPLQNFVQALAAVQRLPFTDPKSFFALSGWHGEPFKGPGRLDGTWWGGYCNHGNVLFPTWHRTMLLKLEDSLRTVENGKYADVTVPYWDELMEATDYPDLPSGNQPLPMPIDPNQTPLLPICMTEPYFTIYGATEADTRTIPNPLYSYKLPRTLTEAVKGKDNLYTKPEGYNTCRFPYSGLVGTEEQKAETDRINAQYAPAEAVDILNENIKNWLAGTVNIGPDGQDTPIAITTSVRRRLWSCLDAPNYTVFSNTTSQRQYYTDNDVNPADDPFFMVALENPHNGMHLALGGVYLPGKSGYNADDDRYRGANGDMGCNETASFDPVFYLHHCFIDYMLWKWQEKNNLTAKGSLDVIEGYDGTVVDEPTVGYPPGTILNMNSPLYPFKKDNGEYYTSLDVTNINDLGYTYAPGSVDAKLASGGGRPRGGGQDNLVGTPAGSGGQLHRILRVSNINRSEYAGSFVIKVYVTPPGWDKPALIAAEPILSRWHTEGCANCQSKLEVDALAAFDKDLLDSLLGDHTKEKVDTLEVSVGIQTFDGETIYKFPMGRGKLAPTAPLLPDGRPRGGLEGPGKGEDGRRLPYIEDLYRR